MHTLPHPQAAGKSTPLLLTTHLCPCCRTPLQRWQLSLYQAPAQVYWCGVCLRPVCLEPPAVQGGAR